MKFRLDIFSETHEINVNYNHEGKLEEISIDGQYFSLDEIPDFLNCEISQGSNINDIFILKRGNETQKFLFKEIMVNENLDSTDTSSILSDEYFVNKKLLAPIPGKIIDIRVKEGQDVKENEILLVLEAMKMENEIHCPRSGKIKMLPIILGESVTEKQILVEFF